MSTWTLLFLISEWVIRLVMLVYVPQRRPPAAARTWLLLIFFEPTIGLILYALFGRIYVPKRRIEMQHHVSRLVRSLGADLFRPEVCASLELPDRFGRARLLAENLGDFGIQAGNHIELISDYAGAVERLIADIDAAQHHVHLQYYIFADDETGCSVVAALERAVARGVACRVLMDSYASRVALRRLAPRMRAAGIEVNALMPLGLFGANLARFDLRNHRKLAVIDGRIGHIGSLNLVDSDFKEGLTYEELVARVTGPVVLQLQLVFLADRYYETEQEPRAPQLFPDPTPAGPSAAQVVPSGPGYERSNVLLLAVALIHAAEWRVVLTTPYFIPDATLLRALQTAVLRGVDVHLVVSRQVDQWLVGLAQRSYYEELLAMGVHIHLYHRNFLHAKHLTVDNAVALVGSSNFDIRSFDLNAEISLLIYDPEVVSRLEAVQDRYFADAEYLTPEAWSRRSVPEKIAENIARLADSFL